MAYNKKTARINKWKKELEHLELKKEVLKSSMYDIKIAGLKNDLRIAGVLK